MRDRETAADDDLAANRHLGDWLPRPLDAISRADVEARSNSITADHGWSAANRAMSLLRTIYRRPCVDHDWLRNPVDLWLASGGKFHRKARRKISASAEVLPCWRAGIEAEVNNPAIRDAIWFGLYTGMRREEVLTLRSERVGMDALPSGSRKPRPACPWNSPSPGNSRPFSNAAGPPPQTEPKAFASGCSRRRRARPAMSKTRIISTPASARPAGPSSGSTACATALSPSPSAS